MDTPKTRVIVIDRLDGDAVISFHDKKDRCLARFFPLRFVAAGSGAI
jgi:hypothetical protein